MNIMSNVVLVIIGDNLDKLYLDIMNLEIYMRSLTTTDSDK